MRGTRNRLAFIVAILAPCATTADVQAGGVGYPGPGTRALGRAGAFAARGDDALAIEYNPALLGRGGQRQILFNSHLAFLDACVQRSGTYTDNVTIRDLSRFGDSELAPGAGGYALEPFPSVCNDTFPIPNPALLASLALTPRIGLGFGLLVPIATGAVKWGDSSGTVVGINGELRPNPLRYLALTTDGFALSPSVGASWQAWPWLRVGLTLQWGIATLDVLSYGVTSGGENPSLDGRAEVSGSDYFIPAVVTGVHVTPIGGLEIGGAFRWSDDIRGSSDIDIRFGDFGSSEPGSTIPTDDQLTDLGFHFPMPWQLTMAVRYVSRRGRSEDATYELDPMRDERWDIELDVVYELNARVDEVVTTPAEDATMTTREVLPNGEVLTQSVPVDSPFRVPRGWKNQLSVRLGGDYTVIRGRWVMRGGLSFETRGLDPALANIDFLPVRRFGLHVGSTVRVRDDVEVSVAYAHLFQETLDVPPAGEPGGAALPQNSADGSGRVINAGTFSSNWNIVSLGVAYLF